MPSAYWASGRLFFAARENQCFVRDQHGTVSAEPPYPVLSMGAATLRHPLQFFRRPVTVVQRNGFVPNNSPHLPACVGFNPCLFRFVVFN